MWYRKEVNEMNMIYQKHNAKRILFTKEISQSIGFERANVLLKIDKISIKGALVSATMNDLLVLAKFDNFMKQKINSLKKIITVNLKFYDPKYRKQINLVLYTKLVKISNNGLSKYQDTHYLSLSLVRRIPDDLIKILGKYHDNNTMIQTERSQLSGLLLINGLEIRCTPQRISDTKITINFDGDPKDFLDEDGIIIINILNTGDTYGIEGTIKQTLLDSLENSLLVLQYEKNNQGREFINNLSILKNIINNR